FASVPCSSYSSKPREEPLSGVKRAINSSAGCTASLLCFTHAFGSAAKQASTLRNAKIVMGLRDIIPRLCQIEFRCEAKTSVLGREINLADQNRSTKLSHASR